MPPAQGPRGELISQRLDATLAGEQRSLSFVPTGGWGNQLLGLARALFIAAQLGRGIVLPHVLPHGDIGGVSCSIAKMLNTAPDSLVKSVTAHIPNAPTRENYDAQMFKSSSSGNPFPRIDAYLDTSAWGVPVVAEQPKCEGSSCYELNPSCMDQKTVNDDYIPSLKTGKAAAAPVLTFGSVFVVHQEPGWKDGTNAGMVGCKIHYKSDLADRVRTLLDPPYDAIHVRSVTEDNEGSTGNADWRVQLTHVLSDTGPPLYIMTDNLTAVLEFAQPLAKRTLLTYKDLNNSNPAGFTAVTPLGTESGGRFMV